MRGKYVRYSAELAEEILARLRAGESVYRIGQDPRMPTHCTLRRWAKDRPEFGAALAAARDPAHFKHPGGFAGAGPGRRVGYTPELAREVCERLSRGRSMRALVEDRDLPSPATLFNWMAQFPEFRALYLAACEARALLLREEALEIADDPAEAPARAKLRVDVRLKAAALMPRAPGPPAPRKPEPEPEACWEDLLEAAMRRHPDPDE